MNWEYKKEVTGIFHTKLSTGTNIVTLFEQQVNLTPDSIAFICKDTTYNYSELNSLANQFARFLISEYSIQPGDVVGLLVDKTDITYLCILAILKCGASYLPVSEESPTERIDYMLKSSSSKLLITKNCFENKVCSIKTTLICVDNFNVFVNKQSPDNLNINISPNHCAYIMYTSGTTNNPNAVQVPHKAVVRLVKGSDYFPFHLNHTYLQFSNISFDASTFEIWAALLNGNSFVASNAFLTDLIILSEIIRKQEITSMFLTTSFFNMLVDEKMEILASLKYLLIGGEALSVKHVQKFRLKYPQINVFNAYGPTECTTFACCYQIPTDFDFKRTSIPIGKAITETTTYIFNDAFKVCEINEKGELYLGGNGLAKGYLNNDKLNQERFVYHPSNKQERLYKTGDLCSFDNDGNIIYHGRLDNQLKIRGYRIEIEEIENTLNRHYLIQNCVIVAQKTKWSTSMIAYIVGKDGEYNEDIVVLNTIDINILKNDLLKWLPEYMIPSVFIQLNRIPLNKNSKADRNKLLNIFEVSIKARNNEALQISDKTDEIIYYIWKKHLPNSLIDFDTSFFDLGGDSLQAVSVINDINKQLNLNISVINIYKSPTIRLFADFIHNLNCTEIQHEKISLLKNGIGTVLFLAPGLGGDALTFIHFVKYYKADNPIYCFNYPSPDSINNDLTMEKLAEQYLVEITKICPAMNIQLLGFSFGGRLVFEIALQLQKKGIGVKKLIITDIVAPSFKINYIKAIDILSFELYLFKHIPLKAKYKFLRKRIGGLIRLYLKKESENSKNTNIQINTNDSVYHKIYYNYHTFEKYNGDMILFRAKQESASPYRKLYYLNLINSYLFWNSNINGKIHKFELECDHTQFFNKENVKGIIQNL